MTAANAQNATDEKVQAEGPSYVQEFLDNFVMTRGVSSDGNYVFGNIGADVPACIYIMSRPMTPCLFSTPKRAT